MPEEIQDVEQDVVDLEDVNEDVINPDDEEDISEEATPQQADVEEEAPAEEQRVPYDRFKEKVDEVNYYKQLHEQTLRNIGQQNQPKPQEVDPYAGMDAETTNFWRQVDKRAETIAERKFKQAEKILNAGKQDLANIQAMQFYKDHPDVKRGSQAEAEISNYVRSGYPLEQAYKLTMFDRIQADTTVKVKKQVKQKVQLKKRANTEESNGVSQASKPSGKKTFRDTAREMFDLAEQGKL